MTLFPRLGPIHDGVDGVAPADRTASLGGQAPENACLLPGRPRISLRPSLAPAANSFSQTRRSLSPLVNSPRRRELAPRLPGPSAVRHHDSDRSYAASFPAVRRWQHATVPKSELVDTPRKFPPRVVRGEVPPGVGLPSPSASPPWLRPPPAGRLLQSLPASGLRPAIPPIRAPPWPAPAAWPAMISSRSSRDWTAQTPSASHSWTIAPRPADTRWSRRQHSSPSAANQSRFASPPTRLPCVP